MNAEMFLDELGRIFDKTPKPAQEQVYRDKLRRFSPEQLLEILNRVIEEARNYPKVSEIFKAANDLGFLAIDTTQTRSHHWKPTDCGSCHGEGRLAIFWEFHIEDRENGRVEIQRMVKVAQYCKSFEYHMPTNQFRTIFRCRCLAGDTSTIPKSFPKLTKETPTQREVWL